MTDPTPTPTPPADPQASANPSTQGDPADLGDAGRRAIAAERAAAADATRQLRETQMQLVGMQGRVTELENTLGTLTTERDTATGDALRYRVALENGVPPALAGRLQGADEASLIADAATLLGAIPNASLPTARPPKPDLTQGSRTPVNASPEAEFQRWLQAQSS